MAERMYFEGVASPPISLLSELNRTQKNMRIRTWSAALIAVALTATSCSENPSPTTGPVQYDGGIARVHGESNLPAVRISEFHYDNTGTDTGEQIEISGPAGTNLTGWKLVLISGEGTRLEYNTVNLTATIPATCGPRGVVVVAYNSNGIQNGAPDGIALVRPNGNVSEFLSYEGNFVAANSPAIGMRSTDIGVSEVGTEPVGPVTSLSRNGHGVWVKNPTPATPTSPAGSRNTFGICNDDGVPAVETGEVATVTISPAEGRIVQGGTQLFVATAFDSDNRRIVDAEFTWSTSATSVNANGFVTASAAGAFTVTATTSNGIAGTASLEVVQPSPLPPIRLTEIHYDNGGENNGADVGEALEIEGPAGASLAGWKIVLYNGNGGGEYDTIELSGLIPSTCSPRGVVAIQRAGIQNGEPDGIALVNGTTVVEFLSYEGVLEATDGPADGITSTDIGVSEGGGTPAGLSLQRAPSGIWRSPATATFGACNTAEGSGGGGGGRLITFSGRSATADPPLPVGFEAQLFPTLRDGSVSVPTTFSWSSDTPDIGSVDASGVIRGLAAGSAIFRATAEDGTTGTITLPIAVPTASTTAEYVGNTEFGEPADGNASDDFIITRPEYVASYNKNRNTPNWVAYNIDPSQFGGVDRCNCFTHDPLLPADFTRLNTNSYTGAGDSAGYRIDRGHLARSFDRSSGTLDNARTFYLSNIIPQSSELNQGTWANMENDLGNLARFGGKEVYVITGATGSKGTVKNVTGTAAITIPEHVWKVAVVLDHNERLSDVRDYRDLEVIAVMMRNEASVTGPWRDYETTVDEIEKLSGYDLLALLSDDIENAVESNSKPPIATVNGPFSGNEGSAISMSASGSVDPNGTIVSYAWDFGDGNTGAGPSVSHTYAQDREYTVTMTATDNDGLTDVVVTTASVANVPPVVSTFPGAILLPGESYSATGTFTDPGADSWSAEVNYGEGPNFSPLALSGKNFTLSHTYDQAGTFTVTVRVTDDDAIGGRTAIVLVLSHAAAIAQAREMIEAFEASGTLSAGNLNSLSVKLDAAMKQIENGNNNAAGNQLQAFLNELRAMGNAGRLTAGEMMPLQRLVARLVESLSL
jgi:DNA/RNA endonuclease G (NUC1)